MNTTNTPMHYVCTLEQAVELISEQENFWVSNCGCREGEGECGRSRMDVCLNFFISAACSGSGRKKIGKKAVEEIIKEAKEKNLVPRPFRDATKTYTEGICFCCDDCCAYFQDAEEECDKGTLISVTDDEGCNHCGVCVEVCYFKARVMKDSEMVYLKGQCYGCGLCADACVQECISMKDR
jgi:Pyruvate/2-oxoacid:ferredoxin oxidoreductase delta subunit